MSIFGLEPLLFLSSPGGGLPIAIACQQLLDRDQRGLRKRKGKLETDSFKQVISGDSGKRVFQ